MVDDQRAQTWEREARAAHAHYYGTDNPVAHFAGIVLALLQDREDLLVHTALPTSHRMATKRAGAAILQMNLDPERLAEVHQPLSYQLSAFAGYCGESSGHRQERCPEREPPA